MAGDVQVVELVIMEIGTDESGSMRSRFINFCLSVGLILGGCSGGVNAPAEVPGDAQGSSDLIQVSVCDQHLDCDDQNQCTQDLCEINGACRNVVMTGASCDDGDPCTQGAICEETGVCAGPSVGPMPAPECFSCTCDLELGMNCSRMDAGSSCESLDPCTVNATCSSEAECEGESPCVHGECVVVEDGFVCGCLEGWQGARCEEPAP